MMVSSELKYRFQISFIQNLKKYLKKKAKAGVKISYL